MKLWRKKTEKRSEGEKQKNGEKPILKDKKCARSRARRLYTPIFGQSVHHTLILRKDFSID